MKISCGRALTAAVLLGAGVGLGAAPAAGAATVAVVDDAVVFTAASGEANDVTATEVAPGGDLAIGDAGAPLTAGSGCTQVDAHTAVCAGGAIEPRPLTVLAGDRSDRVFMDVACCRQVTARGGIGRDALTMNSNSGAPVELDGGPGDDELLSNEQLGGAPILRGGDGDDSLRICCSTTGGGLEYGGPGDDYVEWGSPFRNASAPLLLDGGPGDDTYAFPILFEATALAAGGGTDTLDQRDGHFALDFDFSSCPGCVQRVIGTSETDHIVGDGRAQVILGGPGDDALDGGGGADTIAGQRGNDAIEARDGVRDRLTCNGGTDSVFADRIDSVSRDCETITRGPGV